MASLDIFELANKKAKGKRPSFLDDPAIERVLSITLAVAGELAVMRERLDTIERLMENGQQVTRDAIDSFEPTMAEAQERAMWQQEYLSRIFRIVQQELEALDNEDPSSEELSGELARK